MIVPDFYELPPFFTLQPNLQSQQKQMQMWSDVLISHCAAAETYELTLDDSIFENKGIKRKLARDAYEALVKFMVAAERADVLPGGGVRI